MSDPLGPRLLAACAVAREAGALAHRLFLARASLETELKGHQDVVSIADREVEELMRARLGEAFPGDGFLGEEGGGAEAERLWVIDPIDGTANFLRGMPYWAVVLAYVEGGRAEIGVTYDPVHDELFVARPGGGAFRNGEPIRVRDGDDPRRAAVGLSFNYKQSSERYVTLIDDLCRHGLDHRRMGSTALTLCHVADGRIEACISLLCSSWDVLAGLVLVREAGGLASEFTDGCGLTGTRAVAAASPGLAPLIASISGETLV